MSLSIECAAALLHYYLLDTLVLLKCTRYIMQIGYVYASDFPARQTSRNHREHTIVLNRKRVNDGMKRTNSLPLSPVVLTRPYCRKNRYLQVLRSPLALNSYLGFSELCKKIFCLTYKIWQGRQLFAETLWTQSEYSLESLNFVAFTKPNKYKTNSKDFSITWPNLFSNTFKTFTIFRNQSFTIFRAITRTGCR